MIEIIINKNDSGQRMDRFLMKAYPALTQGAICKAIRKNQIKLNSKKQDSKTKLCESDIIKIFIPDSLLETKKKDENFINLKPSFDVIYEDENIILIEKEAGVVVHEDNNGETNTLINQIKSYLYNKGEYNPEVEQSFAPALCNRLDRNTGGIIIAAKNAASLRILSQKIKDRELTKLYLCVVCGVPPKKSDTLTAFLEKRQDENKVMITNKKTPSNLTIKTSYRVIDSCKKFSLLEVDLLTGRTHQIRAHLSYIGNPLLGDGKYGINKTNKELGYKYQALYSYKLIFNFTTPSYELEYLNHKEFTAKNIWILDKYYNDKKEVSK